MSRFKISKQIVEIAEKADEVSRQIINNYQSSIKYNHIKILNAFQKSNVYDECFKGSTGYGYGDYGRDTLEQLYANVFATESALVRTQIVSGTHAIALCLFGILKPNDRIISITGTPYDTLLKVIGYPEITPGSLREAGIKYEEIQLTPEGKPDYDAISLKLQTDTKMVLIQRSRGYSLRPSLTIEEIARLIKLVKAINPNIICFVDNCYGEFVEEKEPPQVGADLTAGSLIKNPGGGLAPSGGYIVGKENLIERISIRLTAPGIGKEIGSAPGYIYRLLYQGLYMAPHIVAQALESAIFAAALFSDLGYEVNPLAQEKRTDIIQTIKLCSKESLIAFCQGLQAASPIDAHVIPEPWAMPGYEDKVIMAGGTFVQGSTIELSADAPLRSPFAVYLQGGLSKDYAKIAIINACQYVLNINQ
ncbi:methionine gamma-lyase family protein [Bacillota bacterium LX-D]|nr:methionine gamma-lyase family protein [Bacillota bacterium LX-D]